ncbi:MAG: hypothetical protein O7H39_10315 [Gammaproteobacteria bacterium]|nr:hypothetical protein [Gammaproteobacteria bacterium]
MTLTPQLQIVKRCAEHPLAPIFISVLVFLSTATLSLLAWTTVTQATAAERADRFGASIAREVAALAAEPMLTQDRIRLSVLSNRVAELPEVVGISIYSVDNQLLAVSARTSARGPVRNFSHAVEMGDTISGYVHVVLAQETFGVSLAMLLRRSWGWWLVALLLAVTVGYAFRFAKTVRPKRAAVLDRGLERASSTSAHVYVLVVNLFNQISISPDRRTEALTSVLRRATQIANLYIGRAEPLSGTGILLAFDDTRAPDRCFEIICAALLLGQVLERLNHIDPTHSASDSSLSSLGSPGAKLEFRYGLHYSPYLTNFTELCQSDAVRDAVMLSALAPDTSLAVSDGIFATLDRPDRVEFESHRSAALGSALTTTDECFIVTSVTESYRALLDRQAELLSG